jgi:hypothetical protein
MSVRRIVIGRGKSRVVANLGTDEKQREQNATDLKQYIGL